jgi:hypothetical protein
VADDGPEYEGKVTGAGDEDSGAMDDAEPAPSDAAAVGARFIARDFAAVCAKDADGKRKRRVGRARRAFMRSPRRPI